MSLFFDKSDDKAQYQEIKLEKNKIKSNLMEFSNLPKPSKKIADITNVTRYTPRENVGLSDEQVIDRYQKGFVNFDRSKKGKSIPQIIFGNIVTFFNIIYAIIATLLIIYGQYKQITFLAVVVANTLIAIIQEIRSKKSLDKLNLITMPTVVVVRNGHQYRVAVDSLVLDDIILLEAGKQVCADCVIISGTVEANESILTGESESVVKSSGDTLYSGSYIVSNNCVARVDKVGKFNFIETLTSQARKYKKPNSQLLKSFNVILYVIAVLIFPLTYFMWQVNSMASNDFITTLLSTSSPIIGIIPAGPFLLTSITLALSVIRLAQHNTMAQELYCIEMLARVDTLCLDKTGTITDGTMNVVECIDLRLGGDRYEIKDIISSLQNVLKDNNATAIALKNYFGDNAVDGLKMTTVVPFSSARKFSAVSFENNGTYFLGAPEFILSNTKGRVDDLVKKYATEGYRVLLLAYSSSSIFVSEKNSTQLPLIRKPVALVVIEDHIREDAPETLKWFADNGVDLKVISGDNPITVGNIASKVGLANADKIISLEGMSDSDITAIADQYTVFGRVTPDQKAILVKAIKSRGHIVAMTGDGVNDILALRESDCSIALASGADAARNVSHLVLLDNNFSNLPRVVAEGRRVVNNIQNASSMFFMKTVFTVALMFFIIIMDVGFGRSYYYPFRSTNIMLLEMLIVGLSTTLLAIQPNTSIIKGHFLANVFKKSLPASITFITATLFLYAFQAKTGIATSNENFITIAAIVYTFCGFYALYMACKPLNIWKIVYLIAVCVLIIVGTIAFRDFFDYEVLNREEILLLLSTAFASAPFYLLLYKLFNGFESNPVK